MSVRGSTAAVVAGLVAVGVLAFCGVALAAGPPSVDSEGASGVGPFGATLEARVNPQEQETTCVRFEYGTTAAYGSSVPCANGSLGSGTEDQLTSASVTELQPGTEYHFRVVVENLSSPLGGTVGSDRTFTTPLLVVGIPGLPDGRVYEMVTPPENQDANVLSPDAYAITSYEDGGTYGVPTIRPFRAAADGDAVAYLAEPTSPNGAGIRGFGEEGGNDYIATRSAGGGWKQVNLQPTGERTALYQAFSSDLSIGILEAGYPEHENEPPLTADAPQGVNVLYARATDGSSYSPLFTTTPPNEMGRNFRSVESLGLRFAGASADYSRRLFEANDALSPEAVNGGRGEDNLYASVDGSLSAVNILPGATVSEPNAVFGSIPNARAFDFSHVISADGSLIFWTDLNAGPDGGHIFVRENGTSTVAVSTGSAEYWTASADGRYAFYTEGEQLLRFDVREKTREVLAGIGAEVQGVLGASEDGNYLYFAADGVLAPGAQAGQPNLYLLHNAGGGWEAPRFIATLSPRDGGGLEMGRQYELPTGDWVGNLANQTAEVTPDGRSLVFMSRNNLPAAGFPHGYNSTGLAEVYVYQAGEGGRLSCASCNPSGELPKPQYIENAGVAAFLPVEFAATYQPRWISENGGRVFFDSLEPLVARDTNGLPDVYEWERDGEGSCTQPSGCVYLLSSGTGNTASFFIDASASGDDAFIVSADRLVPQDRNENANLYDVRVGGVNLLPPAAGCGGVDCQGATPTASGSGVPASETFTGSGNLAPPVEHGITAPVRPKPRSLTKAQKLARALRACASGSRKQRVACERRARRLYGPPVRARKTSVGRRSIGEGRS